VSIASDLLAGLKAIPIVLGVVVDWILTTLFSVSLTRARLDPGVLALEGAEFNAAFNASIEDLFQDPSYLVGSLMCGLLATVIGAFIGARNAGTLPLKHGLAVAVASGLSVIVSNLTGSDDSGLAIPIWFNVIGWLLLLPAGVMGGYLAMRRVNTDGGSGQ
jgi:hypothetical protein